MVIPKPINHSAKSVGQSPADPQGVPLSTRNRSGRPHLEKTWRNACWTAVGSTWFQCPWGENRRLHDGAAAFVYEAEPTYPFAIGQENPLRSIHLPNLMGPTRTIRIAGGTSSGRSWRQRGSSKPALQRSFAAAGAEFLLQQDANQASTPGGMLLPHVHCLVEQGTVRCQRLGGATCVVRIHPGLPSPSKPLHQVSHRAFTEIEFFGKLGHGRSLLPTLKNYLSHRNGNGRRHERILHDSVKIN